MQRIVSAVVIAGAIVCSTAASAETRFRGAFTLTRVQDCLARYVGETFNSTFRPARIGGNPNITSLTQLNAYSGDVYELAGAGFEVGQWRRVRGYGIDNLHYEFNARINIGLLLPAKIQPTTTFVSIAGSIENMGNDPGIGGKPCIASFRGAYFRRTE